MSKLKPEAWVIDDGYCKFTTSMECELKTASKNNWTVTPLYAIPEGFVVVPVEPTENQWSGLARHLMMWLDFTDRPTGEKLYSHLDMLGIDPPAWLLEEIPNTDTVPSKGTRVAVIYKAMIKATKEGLTL